MRCAACVLHLLFLFSFLALHQWWAAANGELYYICVQAALAENVCMAAYQLAVGWAQFGDIWRASGQ